MTTLEKQDVATNRKHRFTFLVTTHGETASDLESGIECLPHNSCGLSQAARAQHTHWATTLKGTPKRTKPTTFHFDAE